MVNGSTIPASLCPVDGQVRANGLRHEQHRSPLLEEGITCRNIEDITVLRTQDSYVGRDGIVSSSQNFKLG
ncbi:hypothetical protein JG688_00017532 [Phytophthora aleatoria]|uniref:Uncharacterized protein n=1 Tax=Phytophthora aleatoria TaxID=2496075 RepID=A0A8J5IQL7_9STRA|nr:hypothetical protein JG688_00017532 [Phytophthora aleatoria]